MYTSLDDLLKSDKPQILRSHEEIAKELAACQAALTQITKKSATGRGRRRSLKARIRILDKLLAVTPKIGTTPPHREVGPHCAPGYGPDEWRDLTAT
jgi:hypothetical protein